MTIDTLKKLTNLVAKIDLAGIDERVELTDADRAYLREHAHESECEIRDITDYCAHWKLSAQVFFAGAHVADVDAKGDITMR